MSTPALIKWGTGAIRNPYSPEGYKDRIQGEALCPKNVLYIIIFLDQFLLHIWVNFYYILDFDEKYIGAFLQ